LTADVGLIRVVVRRCAPRKQRMAICRLVVASATRNDYVISAYPLQTSYGGK
jgi:hypothetical protein